MKETKVKFSLFAKRVAIILPLLIFSYLALSVTFAQNNIEATVSISPSISTMECKPDVLTINSDVTWIYCFIEFDNADVNDIRLSTVHLSADGYSGNILADQSFFHTGDFLNDGKEQALVRFSRSSADSLWFLKPTIPSSRTFNLVISGNLENSFLFSGTDSIIVLKSSGNVFSAYQRNGGPADAEIIRIKDFDLEHYEPKSVVFNGYFSSRGDPRVGGVNGFYTSGNLVTVRKIIFLGIIPITLYNKVPYTIAASFDRYDDCSVLKVEKIIHCEGNGSLIMVNQKTGEYTRTVIPTLRFDIADGKVSIEGGEIWNDMISVRNVVVKQIRIT